MTNAEKLRALLVQYNDYLELKTDAHNALFGSKGEEERAAIDVAMEAKAEELLAGASELVGGVLDDLHAIAEGVHALTVKGNHP
jgi:hypothetical protein